MTKEYYYIGLAQDKIDTEYSIQVLIPHDFILLKIIMPITTPTFNIRLFNKNIELYDEFNLMIENEKTHYILYKPVKLKKDTLTTSSAPPK